MPSAPGWPLSTGWAGHRGLVGGAGGQGLPHCSPPILPAKVVDVDNESVAMGTDHVPDFLVVDALIFLHNTTNHQSQCVCVCVCRWVCILHTAIQSELILAYTVVKEVDVLSLVLSQVLFRIHFCKHSLSRRSLPRSLLHAHPAPRQIPAKLGGLRMRSSTWRQ